MTSHPLLYTDLTSKPTFSSTHHRQGYILYFWAQWHESSAPGGSTHSLFETLAASVISPTSSSSSSSSSSIPSAIHCGRIEAERYPSLCHEYKVTVVPTFVFVYSDPERPIQKWEGVFDMMTSDTQSVLSLTQATQDLLEWTRHDCTIPTKTSITHSIVSETLASSVSHDSSPSSGQNKLQRLLQTAVSCPILVFLKGTPTHHHVPSTESKNLISLLQKSNIEFQSFDLSDDTVILQALQEMHTTTTTTTQSTQDTFVYVHGKYIGGYDTLIQKIQEVDSTIPEEGYILTLDLLGLSSKEEEEEEGETPSKQTLLASTSKNTTTSILSTTYSTTNHTITTTSTTSNIQDRLEKLIHQSKVMVFMKGLPSAPRCGFSRQICEILNQTQIPYEAFDILQDESVRQGLKDYSKWPTYPQLYVKGELIGGLDIVKELVETNELEDVLNGQ